MSSFFDFINNNQALQILLGFMELGLNTERLNILLPHFKTFDLCDDVFTKEHVYQFKREVEDDMLAHGYSRRDVMEIGNTLSICGIAAVSIQSDPVLRNDVDMSWVARYFDYIKNINDEELQPLWSKILVQEIKKQNSYYKRTLDVFYKADKFEIDWFFEITKYVFDKSCVPEFILSNNRFYPFNRFQTLIDAGFVNASRGSLSYPGEVIMQLTSVDIKIEIPKPPFGFSIYTLTDAGSQLFDLQPEAASEEYISKLKEVIERGNLAKVVAIERK